MRVVKTLSSGILSKDIVTLNFERQARNLIQIEMDGLASRLPITDKCY